MCINIPLCKRIMRHKNSTKPLSYRATLALRSLDWWSPSSHLLAMILMGSVIISPSAEVNLQSHMANVASTKTKFPQNTWSLIWALLKVCKKNTNCDFSKPVRFLFGSCGISTHAHETSRLATPCQLATSEGRIFNFGRPKPTNSINPWTYNTVYELVENLNELSKKQRHSKRYSNLCSTAFKVNVH